MSRQTLAIMAGVLVLASTTSVAQVPGPKPASPAPNTTPPETHRTADSGNSSKQHGAASARIKALQKSRIETLTELVKEYEVLYQAGRIDFYYVVAAQDDLVDAKLDLAEKPEERVALLTEKMKLAEANLERTERRFRTSLATKSDLLRARALLLAPKSDCRRTDGGGITSAREPPNTGRRFALEGAHHAARANEVTPGAEAALSAACLPLRRTQRVGRIGGPALADASLSHPT